LRDLGNRIAGHAVLDVRKTAPPVTITVDGAEIEAYEGEMVLAALFANGIKINRYTVKRREPRGLFCGIGQCTDCAMVVDGAANTRTCITPVRAGMDIRTQDGLAAKGGG
jgi:predicted molibdopterin-dependent oxidoreductase YjgC